MTAFYVGQDDYIVKLNQLAPWTIKGALVTGDGNGTPVTLAPGANNYILIADSSKPGGVKWAPASNASYTLPIASATELGGIRIGTGLFIDADGKVSASTGAGNADLSQGINSANTVVILSSTGTAATLSPATSTAAGILTSTDKQKLDLLASTGVPTLSSLGAQARAEKDELNGYVGLTGSSINSYNQDRTILSYITNSNTSAHTYILPDKNGTIALTSDVPNIPIATATTTGILKVGNGLNISPDGILSTSGTGVGLGTDIAQGINTVSTVVITSSTGTSAELQPASADAAGIMTRADKMKLDNQSGVNTGDQTLVELNGQNINDKDAINGYVGLSGYSINIKDNLGINTSFISNFNTLPRTYVLPDKDGTLATIGDLPSPTIFSDVDSLKLDIIGKAPIQHSHLNADLIELQTSLDLKSNTNHTHVINDLLDVDTLTNPPGINDSLVWDGFNWVPDSKHGIAIKPPPMTYPMDLMSMASNFGSSAHHNCHYRSNATGPTEVYVQPDSYWVGTEEYWVNWGNPTMPGPMPIGGSAVFGKHSSGDIIFVPGPGVTINTPSSMVIGKLHGKATLIKVAINEWDLEGHMDIV